MKITFILPAIGKKKGEPYIKTWKMEPLSIAYLKTLTPPHIETEFYDDRIELINYDTKTDLVALTIDTYSALRAYKIAGEFRKRGIKVIAGGYHVTLVPDEALRFVDAVVIGNAEGIWKKAVEDFERGKAKRIYHGEPLYLDILPDRSLFKDKKYLPISLIETGRGCPHQCEFCSVTKYYNADYHPRQIEHIIKDIESRKHNYMFFVDDNIFANPEFAMKLFKEITHLKIHWSSQGAVTGGRNPQLMQWAKKSGGDMILIGFESLEKENLRQMGKEWSAEVGEKNQMIKSFHSEGLNIYASFVFGFDYDTKDSFKKTLDFALEHDFYFSAFNHLLPMPGTPLAERLKKEGRLIKDQWWLDPGYRYGGIPFQPKHLTPEELAQNCTKTRRDFFRYSSILKRGISLLFRKPTFQIYSLFYLQNLTLKWEVDGKLNIPLGENLDETPK